jgi:hypothetical protein
LAQQAQLTVRANAPRDWYDLLMQAHPFGPVKRHATEQDDTSLCAGDQEHASAVQAGPKTLRYKPGHQSPNQPMFDMQVANFGCVALIGQDDRIEGQTL